MKKKELNFLESLYNKTLENELTWDELEFGDVRQILDKMSQPYHSIVRCYATLSRKNYKYSTVGKVRIKIYLDEDEFVYEEYVFFAISSYDDFSNSIVYGEHELEADGIQLCNKIYRLIEEAEAEDAFDSFF